MVGCNIKENNFSFKLNNFNKFIKLCDEACKTYGDRFTYTLIEEKDLIL